MGQGLLPLELTECVTDSPFFRDTLHSYEKELQNTNSSIKLLIKILKDLLAAARRLSECQRAFASAMNSFRFACIGGSQTDDESVISSSLHEFARLVTNIETERERMLDSECNLFVLALENFRSTHISKAKEDRKKFEKQTQKFCNSLERHLNLSTKKMEDHTIKEADACLEMEQRCFIQTSMNYVCQLQEIEQRKKFDLVETLLRFIYCWLTFYHYGYELAQDWEPFKTDLQTRLQKTREEFDETRTKVETLKNKTLEKGQTKSSIFTRQGYLYLMEKKAFGTTWNKYYCMYEKRSKVLTLVAFNQLNGKATPSEPLVLRLISCVRRMADSIERRFCFDVSTAMGSASGSSGGSGSGGGSGANAGGGAGVGGGSASGQDRDPVYTFQATSEEDRRLWLDAMDGKEPTYCKPFLDSGVEQTQLDESGFSFVTMCIAVLEGRGLEEQGLYRLVGVSSKVNKLVQLGRNRAQLEKHIAAPDCETKTVTSALKTYFRNLPEPLMTYRLHEHFIAAAKKDDRRARLDEITQLVNKLPKINHQMLKILMLHLTNVSNKADCNLMSVSNLGVCFGPTLMRAEEETMATIIDIKFCNTVVETLIRNFDQIFYSGSGEQCVAGQTGASGGGGSGGGGGGGGDCSKSLASASSSAVSFAPAAAAATLGVLPSGTIISATAQPARVTGGGPERDTKLTKPPRPAFSSPFRTSPPTSPPSAETTSAATASTQRPRHLPPPYPYPPAPCYPPSALFATCGTSPLQPAPPAATEYLHKQQQQQQILGGDRMDSVTTVTDCARKDDCLTSSQNSMSSSNESLSSRSSREQQQQQQQLQQLQLSQKNQLTPVAISPLSRGKLGINYPPSYRSQTDLRVRTLYACVGENSSELSFEPNQIITNVRPSREPGWLQGSLNGHFGLVPDNYVEYLP